MDGFLLTAENYYSREANQAYYSASQIKQFMECPACAMAELRGEYERKKTPSLLVGGYIDAHFSGEMEAFRRENPGIFTRVGTLKADYVQAEEIIARIERDPLAMRLLDGEKQRIVTGEIAGLPVKAKLDVWLDAEKARAIAADYPGMEALTFADGAIVDMKVMKDFEPMYRQEEGRISFIEYWRYDLQMAIYQELMRKETGHQVPAFILAASKQDPPGLTLVQIPQELLDFNLMQLTKRLPEYEEVKSGREEPEACGKCAYCRKHHFLDGPQMAGMMLWT